MENKDLEICPNCGRKLNGSEFQPTWDMPVNWLPTSVDPVMGRFRCPDCGYNGISVKVPAEEYPKMEFRRNTSFSTPVPKTRLFLGIILLFLIGVPIVSLLKFNLIAVILWAAALAYMLKGQIIAQGKNLQTLLLAAIFIAVLIYIILKWSAGI
ncbi:MAG: hypothetical protein NTY83_01855 [Candidatus Micrarchaeota archaeon]|nr:hypothetical protein [Candidatus Micrarchaeota archaeon]